MPSIPTSSYAIGTPGYRQGHNQYASPGAAYQRGLESMLGPFAFQQQFGGGGGGGNGILPYGQTKIQSPSVTPVNPISDSLINALMGGGQPAAPAGPQRPSWLPASQGWSPPPQQQAPQQQPGAGRQMGIPGIPGYVSSMYPPPFVTGAQTGGMPQGPPNDVIQQRNGLLPYPGVGMPMMSRSTPTPQAPPAMPQGQPQQQPNRASVSNIQQSAENALASMFPQLAQGLAGYGQSLNLPLNELSQMAGQAGQTRADMLGSQFDRDRSQALAQLFQQGRQQQIGMYGDLGQFQVGLLGQQQQEQQNAARLLQQLMLGLV